jgi:hypothetical protein
MKRFIIYLAALVWPFAGALAQQPEKVGGSIIYDHNPTTKVGDAVFGTLVADVENDQPGRCTHGGPVCMELANGDLVAMYANTSDHNIDGWTEYAVSKDGGKTWSKYNKFTYSHEAYTRNPQQPAWVEEGLVTADGTVVLFLTHFENGQRSKNGVMRSEDHGQTWSRFDPLDLVGYPTSVAVVGQTNYVLIDSHEGPHVLYVSTDDGRTWTQRSVLPLDDETWYGALCVMADGRLLAGAYHTPDGEHFYYCISDDEGHSWGKQEKAYVAKKIRDPELAYLDGMYYLHGRSGRSFALYQSKDGIHWDEGTYISSDDGHPDGYSHNCIVNKYNPDRPRELMIQYSIVYAGKDTNEYVFFVRPDSAPDQ